LAAPTHPHFGHHLFDRHETSRAIGAEVATATDAHKWMPSKELNLLKQPPGPQATVSQCHHPPVGRDDAAQGLEQFQPVLIRGHSVALETIRDQVGSAPVHCSKNHPRRPNGVDKHTILPSVVPSMGRTAVKRASRHSAASSTATIQTPLKQRIVAGLSPGRAMIRDPLASSSENWSSRTAPTVRRRSS
jgi:hypothetical protein